MNQTHGNCKWYRKSEGRCIKHLPMWLKGFLLPSDKVEPNEDATDCPCWEKRWVDGR